MVLALAGFGVAFGDRVVLDDVSFELPQSSMTVLVGPSAGGKSTLLRTLAGLNSAHAALTTWGKARFKGAELNLGRQQIPALHERPALVMQHARFFLDSVRENLVSALPNRSELDRREQTQIISAHLISNGLRALTEHMEANVVDLPLAVQRRLAVVRALLADPALLFVDESTSGLDEEDAIEIIATIKAQSRRRAVLFVTHHQRYAQALGGTTLLLAGGRIQERAPTARFFRQPETELGRQFVRTGGCNVPGPERESPAPAAVPQAVRAPERSRFLGPRGFFWAAHGLGGTPRPGIIEPLDYDLDGLRRLDVSVLVTLEETRTVPLEALAARSIRSIHFPIADRGVPELLPTAQLCRMIAEWLAEGRAVAVHCRAGLGRTGTLLGCQLIYSGHDARGALDTLRAINPRCVQSEAQVDFLRTFAAAVKESSVQSSWKAPGQGH